MGKQLMIQSFLLKDLIGRKVIGILPDHQQGGRKLILEGGLTVRLNQELPYVREKAEGELTGAFGLSEIDEILNNPVYAYGTLYVPKELCLEWHKVFLFAASLTDICWDRETVKLYYERFLIFLSENICDVREAPPLIEREVFLETLRVTIEQIKKYLRGEDESSISKDFLRLLDSRYVYLPYLYDILPRPEPGMEAFDPEELKRRVRTAEAAKATAACQKGHLWEQAAVYFVSHVPGLRVTGTRVKTQWQEIDISAVNISMDQELWNLGAYLLVECKNLNERAGISVVRNLAHILTMKGSKTALLFTVHGLTRDAGQEILRLSADEIYILHISKHDLEQVKTSDDCRSLLLKASQHLRQQKLPEQS